MRLFIRYETVAGKQRSVRVFAEVAWDVARAIARRMGYATLEGEYGCARITGNGSGNVAWGPRSTAPGTCTTFDSMTVVCL